MIRHKSPPRTLKNALPIREKVYNDLKFSILSGNFDPGERLAEEHLASEMKVSRTPVREALHKLESEGLIRPRKKRGFIVSRDSREEVEEIFEIRAILEGYALKMISERISDGLLERLDGFIRKAEDALKEKKTNEVFHWNTQFHDTLHAAVSDRKRLQRLIVNMRRYVLRYREDTLQHPDGAERTVEGHRKIVLALQLRDSDLCERIMREHIREARDDALQSLFPKT